MISCPLLFLRGTVPGISNTPRIISPLGKAQKWYSTWPFPRHFPNIPFIAIERTLERRYRDRKVVRWTLVVLASTLPQKKKVGSNRPNCMMPQTTAICISSKNFQANTAKLGIAFGRARPTVGTYRLLRDILRCFKL